MFVETTAQLINFMVSATIPLIGLPANLLVLLTFYLYPNLRNLNNLLVIYLAITDLTRSGILEPIRLHNILNMAQTDGVFVCQFFGVLSALNYMLTAAILASIAFLRYIKIVHPGLHSFHVKKPKIIIYSVILTIFLFILSLLPVFGVGEYQYSSIHGLCFTTWAGKNVIFRSLFYVVTVGIALPVMLSSYVRIFAVVRKHRQTIRPRLRTVSAIEKKGLPSGIPSSTVVDEYSPQIIFKPARPVFTNTNREINITWVMFAMVMIYVVCWTPAFIITVLWLSGYEKVPRDYVRFLATFIEYKCVINPFIYGLGNRQFRASIRDLKVQFFGLFRKK